MVVFQLNGSWCDPSCRFVRQQGNRGTIWQRTWETETGGTEWDQSFSGRLRHECDSCKQRRHFSIFSPDIHQKLF